MIDALTRVWVLPLWTGPVDPKPMIGGMSNVSFYVEDAGQSYVVRFGRDYPQHHVVRSREIMVARAAHHAGFGPEVVYSGPGVVVGRYIEGRSCTAADIRAHMPAIVARLRSFHEVMKREISGAGFMFWPFHVVRDYARLLVRDGHRAAGSADGWRAIANELEDAQVPLPFVIGHNDLIPSNIISDGTSFWFIDYEYTGFSTPLFDLAALAANSDFGMAERYDLLEAYLGSKPDEPTRRAYDAMLCIAPLREGLWGLLSELYVDVGGTDFAAYASNNLARFNIALEHYRSRHGGSR